MSGGANPARGEAALVVAGETLVLRPSFEALVAAEEELGPLFALVERAASGGLKLGEMAALFWHCAAVVEADGAPVRSVRSPGTECGEVAAGEMMALAGFAASGDSVRGVLEALRPPAPVHFRASVGAAGEVALRWARRSRIGWSWLSGQDAPLGEDREAYRLVLTGSGGGGRTVTVSQPAFVYSAAQQQADGTSRPLQARLVQIGAFAPSRPTALIIE